MPESAPRLHPDRRLRALARSWLRGASPRVGLAGAIAVADRVARPDSVPGHPDVQALRWDDADVDDPAWMPQGVTTSVDAGAAPTAAGPGVLLVSWYASDRAGRDAACRISVLDRRDPTRVPYAHVRLVQPYRPWWAPWTVRVRDVPVHAGGIAWCGGTLLVADTRRGLRCFDLDDLVHAPTGLLLVQSGAWRADGGLRHSFVGLDRSGGSLVVGEYRRSGTGTRLARFGIDPDTGEIDPPGALEVQAAGLSSMQGAVRIGGAYVVSASHGADRAGHLWTGPPWQQHEGALPAGPEDLSYDPGTGRVWTVTEYPGRRWVLSVAVPDATRPPDASVEGP